MKKRISVLGVPIDLGQSRRGVDMGPSAIRYADLDGRLGRLGYEVEDLGNLHVQGTPEEEGDVRLRNLNAVSKLCEELATKVSGIVENASFPLVLGGDHSVAIGTLAGLTRQKSDLGVIWFDAHGDMNTEETTPSGNIHGMPLAASLGRGHVALTYIGGFSPKVKAENLVIIGARDLDEGEKELIKELGIKVYSMHEIDRLGMATVMEETIAYLHKCRDGIHLSLDLDALDPHDAPGVGTPVMGGITYRESHLAMEMLAESRLITSIEVVEVNPILDERNKTAQVAVALVASALGETLV